MIIMVPVKEKYLKTKYRPVGILLNILRGYLFIYFRFKLQLKFRKNKNHSTIIVNLRTGLQ
jgi:hypothetical protein